MFRIYCNEIDDVVEQIYNLTLEPEVKDTMNENTFCGFYMVDTEQEVGYNHRFNRETEEFEINPDYVEQISVVEPSIAEELQNQINALQATTLLPNMEMEDLRQENTELRNELAMIKRHLGLA